MGPEDRLLIGIDMLKDIAIMEAAYNDSRGVTARFNLNILNHVNHGLQSDFRLHDFEHRAFFNPDGEQIEMELRARRDVRTELRRIHMHVHVARRSTPRSAESSAGKRQRGCSGAPGCPRLSGTPIPGDGSLSCASRRITVRKNGSRDYLRYVQAPMKRSLK